MISHSNRMDRHLMMVPVRSFAKIIYDRILAFYYFCSDPGNLLRITRFFNFFQSKGISGDR